MIAKTVSEPYSVVWCLSVYFRLASRACRNSLSFWALEAPSLFAALAHYLQLNLLCEQMHVVEQSNTTWHQTWLLVPTMCDLGNSEDISELLFFASVAMGILKIGVFK